MPPGRLHSRLAELADALQKGPSQVVDGALAALAIARCIQQLQQAKQEGEVGAAAVGIVTATLSRFHHRPEQAAQLLETVAATLYSDVGVRFYDGTPLPAGKRDAAGMVTTSVVWWESWRKQCHG